MVYKTKKTNKFFIFIMQNNVSTVDEFIGVQLRILRLKLALSRHDLAALLDVTTEQIRKYELGKNRLSAKSLFTIAYNYNISISYFFQDLENSGLLEKQKPLKEEEAPTSKLKKFLNIH